MAAEPSSVYDVLIVGAGPAGLCCGIELQRAGLKVVLVEKGCVADSLVRFPTYMRFFTSPDGLEIGGFSMAPQLEERPGRTEAVRYYHQVARRAALAIRQYERVHSVQRNGASFAIGTSNARYAARRVVFATGYCEEPVRLNVPGEDQPKVTHYYREPHACFDQKVLVIGGRNSAGAAALELHDAGAEVTIVHRKPVFTTAMKPWLRLELEAKIESGAIRALFNAEVVKIEPDAVLVRKEDFQVERIPNSFVFAMTGYRPDVDFLSRCGVFLHPQTGRPSLDPNTLETSSPGIYLAGVIVSGTNTNELNISHSREHAQRICASILASLKVQGHEKVSDPVSVLT
jgi:thioredoxin reductase (NADPH)